MEITLDDFRAAAGMIEGAVSRTPCTRSRTLSALSEAALFLKLENLQFTASFKERGALVKLLSLTAAEREAGVVAMSAGNHAQAVAYHAGRLGIPATIVMPRFTPNVKIAHTRDFGAEVVLCGDSLEEAGERAREIVRTRNRLLIHPYDDRDVIRGQGTVALEMLEDHPDLEVLVVPVGGGGLISGIAIAAHACRPEVEIVGVEAARFPAVRQALAGEPIACRPDTIAEGIAVKAPGRLTLEAIREHVADMLLVEEADLEEGVRLLLDVEKTVVEGAGAAGLAAVLAHRDRFRGRKVGVVLSGGNIDSMILASIIQRGLVHDGRLVRLRANVSDRPGGLAALAARIAHLNANVVEVFHHRRFTTLPVKSVEIELVLETRGRDHLSEILDSLSADGYHPRVVERD